MEITFYILYLIILLILLCIVQTLQVENSKNQIRFSAGRVLESLPDGVYKGTVFGQTFWWQGKKFDSSANTGINIFGKEKRVERYPFKTYVARGIRDTQTDVFKIDYNIPTNAFWLRFILDEIVEVNPDEYLGKLHVRLIPHLPFTLAYFELKK